MLIENFPHNPEQLIDLFNHLSSLQKSSFCCGLVSVILTGKLVGQVYDKLQSKD